MCWILDYVVELTSFLHQSERYSDAPRATRGSYRHPRLTEVIINDCARQCKKIFPPVPISHLPPLGGECYRSDQYLRLRFWRPPGKVAASKAEMRELFAVNRS